MTSPVQNLTPRQRFQLSLDNVTKHRDLVDSREFERAADYALMQMIQSEARAVVDGNSAAVVGFRISGAVTFLDTLRNLSEKPATPKVVLPQNLDHKA